MIIISKATCHHQCFTSPAWNRFDSRPTSYFSAVQKNVPAKFFYVYLQVFISLTWVPIVQLCERKYFDATICTGHRKCNIMNMFTRTCTISVHAYFHVLVSLEDKTGEKITIKLTFTLHFHQYLSMQTRIFKSRLMKNGSDLVLTPGGTTTLHYKLQWYYEHSLPKITSRFLHTYRTSWQITQPVRIALRLYQAREISFEFQFNQHVAAWLSGS